MKLKFFVLIFALIIVRLQAAEDGDAQQGPFKTRDAAHLILPRNPINRNPPQEISMQVGKFFLAIQQGKVEAGFKDLFEGNEQIQKRYNTNEFISKTKQALMIYGNCSGWELYDNRPIGERMVSLTYFVYLKQVPLRWRFVYYAADGKEWKLINMSVDDLLDQSILYD